MQIPDSFRYFNPLNSGKPFYYLFCNKVMNFLKKFLPRTEFSSYEDFAANYKLCIPDNFNFAYDVVDEYARLDPQKEALIWINDEDKMRTVTFAELKKLSDKAASAMEKLGIQRGDTVMLMLKQRVEAWVMIIALCKLGAVCVPASFQLTPKDIVYRCNAAKVKYICACAGNDIVPHIVEAYPKCETLIGCALLDSGLPSEKIPDGDVLIDFNGKKQSFADLADLIENGDEHFEHRKNENSDIMLMYFSSGTTGMPKMIVHDYTYPLGHIVTAKYWQQVEDGGRHLTQTDSGWAKFAWGKIYGQWISGAVIAAYDTEKFNAEHMLSVIDRLKLTTFCAPPTIYRFLIKEDMSKTDFSTIHHCSIAGEPLNPEVFYRFKEATGLEVHEGFGQSETTVILANFGFDPIKPGSTGKPSPIYDIDIVDDDGNPCEVGIVGSIVIKNTDKAHPTGLFREYLADDAAMAKSWKNGVYNTGDMAWRDSDGYFWFEGRNDDVIKCSGYRIGPFEVESALLTHPSVLECAVTSAPDPVRGQVVKATVVLARGYEPSDELKKELQNHVKKVTAPYKYPRILEFVSELPKTTSGKIRRVEIRQNDAKAAKSDSEKA